MRLLAFLALQLALLGRPISANVVEDQDGLAIEFPGGLTITNTQSPAQTVTVGGGWCFRLSW